MDLQGQVLIYSTTGCPHCKAAKSKLNELKLPYVDVNLDDHPEERDVMSKFTTKTAVPQIFFNERHVGGNDDLQRLSADELNELIAYVRDQPAPSGAPMFVEAALNNETNGDLSPASLERDEQADFVEHFSKQKSIITSHKASLFHSHEKTFTGSDLITFIAHNKGMERAEAMIFGQRLIDKRFAASIKENAQLKDDNTLYRLAQDWPSKSLNGGLPSYAASISAPELSSLIRKSILKMYAEYLSPDGKSVDYAGIGQCKEFGRYKALTAHLQRVNLGELDRNGKIAFFVNIYNALVIHGNIQYGFPESTWQRYKFFNKASYLIGFHDYSLQDIENGILRSNRKGVGMVSKPFKQSDPRLKYILDPHEPLIHFALVCGAKSCPPIKTYSQENITKQLELAATAFLESDDGCRVDREEGLIGLSMIFKWYKEDFGETPQQVLEWAVAHMADNEKKSDIVALLESKNYKLVHLAYDWGTNKK